jgi:hypothetical protein
MRRTILLSLFAFLAGGAVHGACAQHRGGIRYAPGRGRYHRTRVIAPYGFGYGYSPYGSNYGYSYAPEPAIFVQQPAPPVQPAPPAVEPMGNPVVTEYKWPAAGTASSTSAPETRPFAIVLKDGSTLSALMVFASEDGLHYVDPDEKHLLISISAVDRAATLKLNRARNLNLQLPAAQ